MFVMAIEIFLEFFQKLLIFDFLKAFISIQNTPLIKYHRVLMLLTHIALILPRQLPLTGRIFLKEPLLSIIILNALIKYELRMINLPGQYKSINSIVIKPTSPIMYLGIVNLLLLNNLFHFFTI